MKRTFHCLVCAGIVLLLLQAAVTKAAEKPAEAAIESSVVKIIVRGNQPDLTSPWQKLGVESYSGSGVIIEGRRILTNAHVVEDAVSIEIKRAGTSKRYHGTVAHIAHDCDLALIESREPDLFDGVTPAPLGELPRVRDTVQVYGFPLGGEKLSITSGIVSRIEVSNYAHSFEDLLLAQVDAAINAGNSGGPVVADGRVVGIAVQVEAEGENIGYMVPDPVIRRFVKDVADGRYDGVPKIGVEFQALESAAHRVSLGMTENQTGALATRIDYGSPGDEVLEPEDVLLSIGGAEVANDLTVDRPGIGRVHLLDVYKSMQIGDRVELSILRNGKTLEREIVLAPHRYLVPGRRPQRQPRYLVFGGLVFQPLTIEYLLYFEDPPPDLVNYAIYQNVVTKERSEIVFLQTVLPHEVNRGFHDWADQVIATVNGKVPRNMAHLARIIDDAEGDWLRVVTEIGVYITLDLKKARAAQQEVLAEYGVPRDRVLSE